MANLGLERRAPISGASVAHRLRRQRHAALVQDDRDVPEILLRLRHKTVRTVTEDIEGLRFNTAIARLMEMANVLTHSAVLPREVVENGLCSVAKLRPGAGARQQSGVRCTGQR
jgi:leucyl-tRNA synthetase